MSDIEKEFLPIYEGPRLLETAEVKKCKFKDGKLVAYDDCLVLSNEI